jgi:hypothetical protein
VIEIERQLGAGESALLSTYCASLAYFEAEVYEHLYRAGAGRITVLVDWRDYESSFSDVLALRGLGCDYRVQPVRLPNPSAAFHPKLYLTRGADTATLVVSSANLTLPGFRRNAEIVDRLTVRPDGGDTGALRAYAGLLAQLPALDRRLPRDVRESLEEDAAALEAMTTARSPTSEDGPWFLHTAQIPLIEQIVTLVPQASVERIVAISPFFDPGCLALRALADQYSRATLRVIKPGPRSGKREDDFAGAAVRGLRRRLRVEELEGIAGKERRLHAKLFAFIGKQSAWLLTGSANLTAPAWLRAAALGESGRQGGGNLETCVLRQVTEAEINDLLEPLVCTPVELAKLRYVQPTDADVTQAAPGIALIAAELAAAMLTVIAEPGAWCEGSATIRLAVEARGTRHSFEPALRRLTSDRVLLSVSLDRHPLAEDDTPAIITVESVSHGDDMRGRIWLVRPALLALSSQARAKRRAIQQMVLKAFVASEDYEIIADAVAALVSEVGDLLARGVHASPPSPVDELPSPRPSGRAAISLDDYVTISDDEIVGHNTAGGRTHSARSLLQQLIRAAERLFRETEPRDVDAGGSRYGSDVDGQIDDVAASEFDDELDHADQDTFAVPALRESVLRRIAQQSQMVAAAALDSAVVPQAVEYVVRLLTAVAGVLLRLHLQASIRGNGAAQAPLDALRDLFARAFSLTGTLSGHPRGWLIRAWADAAIQPVLRESLADRVRLARLSVMYAAYASSAGRSDERHDADVPHSGSAGSQGGDHAMVAAGLQIIRDFAGTDSAGLDELIGEQAARLAGQSSGLLTDETLLFELARPAVYELPLTKSVRRWKPLLEMLQCDASGGLSRDSVAKALEEVDPSLYNLYVHIRRLPKGVEMRRSGKGWACSGCDTSVPTRLAAAVVADSGPPCTCEECGRILVPFAMNGVALRAVIEALLDRNSPHGARDGLREDPEPFQND